MHYVSEKVEYNLNTKHSRDVTVDNVDILATMCNTLVSYITQTRGTESYSKDGRNCPI